MLKRSLVLAAAALALAAGLGAAPAQAEIARVNGLDMYYEVHGRGTPLVLIHGAYMSIDSNWAELIPTFARRYRVIAVELQGHGRTRDVDRPITYEGMADDVAALLETLGVPCAAVFGYSMGGGVAIRLAMQYPELVNRLIVASASISYDAYPPDFRSMIEGVTPELMEGTPFHEEYLRLAPDPAAFPRLVEKLRALDLQWFAWPEEEFAKIAVPTLLVFGDADVVSLEHAVKMHKLLGGRMNGDLTGLPKAQLLVLSGTTHFGVISEAQSLAILRKVVPSFLRQTLPAPPPFTM